MCVDAEPMNVCTGFVDSQSTTLDCSGSLECPPVTDATPVDPHPITQADNPDVPSGMSCQGRNVWRPDLGEYKSYTVCSPLDWVGSNGDLD